MIDVTYKRETTIVDIKPGYKSSPLVDGVEIVTKREQDVLDEILKKVRKTIDQQAYSFFFTPRHPTRKAIKLNEC